MFVTTVRVNERLGEKKKSYSAIVLSVITYTGSIIEKMEFSYEGNCVFMQKQLFARIFDSGIRIIISGE